MEFEKTGNRTSEGQALARSSAQFAQEFLFVHAIFKCFAAVDKDDGNFVGIAAADFGIGVDVDFTPIEAAAFMKLDQALFHDFAEMAPLARINHDFASVSHAERV